MVKLLIALTLTLSFNSFASYRVDIVNEENQPMSKDEFETQEAAQAYVNKLKYKWGSDKGWYKKPCKKAEHLIETRVVESEFESITEYHCEKTYSAIISEDVEGDAKKAQEELDKIKIEELKAKDKSMKLEELIELLKLKGVI